MTSFQTYIGSAFASYPVRWIESPETTRSRSVVDKIAEKPVEKVADPDLGKPRSASGDILDISPETKKSLELSRSDTQIKLENEKSDTEKTKKLTTELTEKLPTGADLTLEEQEQVAELQARDQEVRIHEMAHVLAGGAYVTGGPSYEYQTGPDGKGYAIGGSVGIDTSPIEGDPEATIQKMQAVAAAALAPAKPSGQDLKVAAAARQAEAKARAELAQLSSEQPEKGNEEEKVPEFSIVKPADSIAKASSESVAEGTEKSSVWARSASEFTPSSAYKTQSVMTLAAPRFSAFA